MADDAKTRGEVMLQAAKQDWERQLSQRSEEEEDQRRSLNKRVSSMSRILDLVYGMCRIINSERIYLELLNTDVKLLQQKNVLLEVVKMNLFGRSGLQ